MAAPDLLPSGTGGPGPLARGGSLHETPIETDLSNIGRMNLLFREHCLRRARTTDGGVCHYRIIWIDYIRLDANDCVHLEAKCKFSCKVHIIAQKI